LLRLFSPETHNKLRELCVPENEQGNMEWPMSTDVWCWNCCHPFESIPVSIPHIYDSKRNLFFCYGNFCSFSCAKRYVLESSSNSQSCTLLALLRSKIIGNLGTHLGIKAAPPRTSLKVFGGNLSIESFREGIEVLLPHNVLFPHQDVTMERVARPGTTQWPGELGNDSKARISKTKPYSAHIASGSEATHSDPVLEAALETKAMRAIHGSQPVKNNAYKLSRAKPLQNTGDLFSVLNMDVDYEDDD
jgi:hypothetical protein